SAGTTTVARPDGSNEADLEFATPSYDRPEHRPSLLSTSALAASRLMKEKGMPSHYAVDPDETGLEPEQERFDAAQPAKAERLDADARAGERLVERAASTGPSKQPSLLASAKGLFQVGATFLFVETDEGLIIIDQHAYHERILFYQLEARLSSQPIEVQRLLMPEPLELSHQGNAMLGEELGLFREFGFDIQAFGQGGWALYAVPRFVRTAKINEFIASCLDELAESGRAKDPASLRKSMVEMMACRASVKSGDVLSTSEIEMLLREGEKVPHTFACPHGRPTTFRMGFDDLERLFHRR
ncbi:MAG: hypothetical protein KDB07_13285, partial [Planctomycetes bacterium]|nr:hypothetical protein [Planctomycetota bacterium]